MIDRRKAYDALGTAFDSVMNRYDLERRVALVLAHLSRRRPGDRVLEVGCGLGYLSAHLRESGDYSLVSLDIARSLLRAGRGTGRVAVPVCADACALPFPRGRFDLVISTECIEHTPDPRQAVREMIRVTARGGRIVMTCPNAAWHWSVRLANALRLRPYKGYENWPAFAELRAWFEAEGTTVAEHVGFHALPFQLPLARHWLPALDRIVLTHTPALGINQLLVATIPS